jgi:hypothetical protein
VRAHYRATRKNLETRTQLDEYTSGGDPLLLYKILHLLFFLLLRILCKLRIGSRKSYEPGLDAGPLEFQFLRLRGCLTKPLRTPSLCFGVIGKTPGLISRNKFVKKILSASAIAMMYWQDVTRSSLCSGVKDCGTKRAHNFLFSKSSFRIRRTRALGCSTILLSFLMRFVRNFFYQISNSNNVYLSARRFGTATSLVICSSSLPSRNREYKLKTFDWFRASFP